MWPADDRDHLRDLLGGLHVGGRYRLEARLGRGAGGVVYRAFDEQTKRPVCIKALKPRLDGDTDSRRRFNREYEALVDLDHPGICRVFDRGEEGGAAWLAMELIDGDTLVDHLQRGPLSPALSLRVARHAAAALAAAHDHGIVHRDVKPANIMVERGGRVVLVDFGIALRAGDERLTRPGFLLGSSHYVAPELWRGEEPSPATDVWALGVVLYACLTARRPFSAKDPQRLVEQILTSRPVRPRTLNPDADPVVERLVFAALQHDVDHRPAGGGALLDILDRNRRPAACDELTRMVPLPRTPTDVTPLPLPVDRTLAPSPVAMPSSAVANRGLRLLRETHDEEAQDTSLVEVIAGARERRPARTLLVHRHRPQATVVIPRTRPRPAPWSLLAVALVALAAAAPWLAIPLPSVTSPAPATLSRPQAVAASGVASASVAAQHRPITGAPAASAPPSVAEAEGKAVVEDVKPRRPAEQRRLQRKRVRRRVARAARRPPSTQTPPPVDRAAEPSSTSPSPAMTRAIGALSKRVAARGLITGDRAAVDAALRAANAAVAASDLAAFERASASLGRALSDVVVDEAFVRNKLLRFNRAFDRRGAADAERVMAHAEAVNAALSRGHPGRANAALNRAFAALR